MERRQFIQAGTVGLLTAGSVSLVGCSKKSLTQWASTVVLFFEQTLPYFGDVLPGAVPLINHAIQVAKDLKAALDSGSENAIELLNQLLAPDGLFQQVLNEVGLIPNENVRKIVSGILAIAGVALNVIATALSQGAAGAPTTLVAKVRAKHALGTNVIEKAAQSDVLLKALSTLKK